MYHRGGILGIVGYLVIRRINSLRGINAAVGFDPVPGHHLHSTPIAVRQGDVARHAVDLTPISRGWCQDELPEVVR